MAVRLKFHLYHDDAGSTTTRTRLDLEDLAISTASTVTSGEQTLVIGGSAAKTVPLLTMFGSITGFAWSADGKVQMGFGSGGTIAGRAGVVVNDASTAFPTLGAVPNLTVTNLETTTTTVKVWFSGTTVA